jgi:S-adenosylmethionine/arginine decarboxylase-like enzyme
MYDCRVGAADDLELNYRFLEKLVDKLGMTRMSQPVVIHGPRDNKGIELYPDKAGVSGWVALIESGIQIHTLEPTHFVTLDVYSCNCFDPKVVLDYAKETFGFTAHEEHYVQRGAHFDIQQTWPPEETGVGTHLSL